MDEDSAVDGFSKNMMKGGAQTKKGAVGDFAPFASVTQMIPNDTPRGFAMLTTAVPSHRARAEQDD